MSADLWIKFEACETCGRGAECGAELNVTYNLSGMLREAGFNGWDWCTAKPAPEVGAHMLAVLDGMVTDPERWRAMNPPNETPGNVCVGPHSAEASVRIGSRMGKPRNEASPAGNRALTSDSPEPFLAGRLNGESYRERTSAVTSIPKKCSVDTCDRPLCAKGLCRLHWERQHKTGTTDDPKPRAGALNSMWKGDAATYGAVHLRMSSGPRPDTCEECGASGVRFEWALRADVPRNAIKTSPDGLAYSTDPSHYRNLCARCHNVQDLAKSKCKRGHDRTDPANIYVQPSNGKKFCRACERIRRAERAERARVTA